MSTLGLLQPARTITFFIPGIVFQSAAAQGIYGASVLIAPAPYNSIAVFIGAGSTVTKSMRFVLSYTGSDGYVSEMRDIPIPPFAGNFMSLMYFPFCVEYNMNLYGYVANDTDNTAYSITLKIGFAKRMIAGTVPLG